MGTEAINATGADSVRDRGKVIVMLKGRYAGQIDFGAVGPKVKERMS